MAILKMLDKTQYGYLIKGWYLSYYFTAHGGNQDTVSKHLLHFKDGIEPYTSKWIILATTFFTGQFNPDLVLRVLSSEETQCGIIKPLDKLGVEIAMKEGSQYLNTCLCKSRPTKPLKYLKKDERFAEINGVYRFIKPEREIKKILLLDDIITSGTTIVEIKRAIKSEIGNFDLYLFVLGKTYDSWRDENADNSEVLTKLEITVTKEEAWP